MSQYTYLNFTKVNKYSFFILFLISIFIVDSSSQAQSHFATNATVGIQAGYSVITGHYSDSLNNGVGAGFFSFVPLSDSGMLYGALVYNRFSLAHSSNSSMQSFGLTFAPSLYYTLPGDFTIYAGAGLSLHYYTLSAINTDAYDSTTKAGFSISAGIARSLFERTLLIAECAYTISELSHKYFQTASFSIKAGYQFAIHKPEYYVAKEKEKAAMLEKQIVEYFKAGIEHVKAKDHVRALDCFNQVLSLKADHKEALHYVDAILLAIEQYDAARTFIKQNKDYDALPLLAASSQYIADAEKTYKYMQFKHKQDIPELLKKAVDSFNNKHYDDCIATLNIVLLIDPDNTVAKGYMVQSKRIKETIKKLQ